MNKHQSYFLTAGVALIALSCLFPLWRPPSHDFTFLFSPPPASAPDGARLALEWFFLALVTTAGLILTRTRRTVTTVYPTRPYLRIDALPDDVLNKWGAGKRKKATAR
jgi:hypothetical protein